ncbi:efflux RND transporter periplasmic adaptor subunit [Alteraurantiacibacter buctensis]|uniref:Efflux RND transporter periplasmic adaptor subunit n=1 Tax=Alteraurantiacibacter buctensis TaxID=1503981 RepID=A0A844YYM3_9SPHN|nr:efflux RND transporter periplasmic adaptor subunit [Alteraurantiacibacter buctensis]MXO71187.1 efflux RND transporter periplasmic adaptor subunit [Alteraurantiacibacter buctensis]
MTDTTAVNGQDLDEFLGTGKQPFWKRRIVWIPALIAVLLLIAFVIFGQGEKQTEYITEEVTTRSLDLVVTATGNLRPTTQVDVGSETSGKIDMIYVDVNDQVVRGQVLARINTDIIDDQITQGRASVNAAQAAVEQARATLEVDTAQLERLREVHRQSGGRVPSAQELTAAEGAVRRGRATLASAQANVTSAQASLNSALTQRDRAVIRSPITGVVLARQVEPGQTVAASFNTPTLFVLAENLSIMQLRVKVDEADVGQVRAGQPATFTVDAYPGRRFPARVERIDLASGSISTTSADTSGSSGNAVVEYEARLTVSNTEGLLRPGMTASASIETQRTARQMVVPNGALRFEPPEEDDAGGIEMRNDEQFGLEREEERATINAGSRQTIYVLTAENELREVLVTTGLSDGRYTIVTSEDLEPGMKVVTAIKTAEGE